MNKYVLFALIALLFCSCSTSKQDAKTSLNYNIIIGSGGGFTNQHDGYSIDYKGRVSKWKGVSFEKSTPQEIKILDQKDITELNSLLPEILETHFQEKGNMTGYLRVYNDKDSNSISWNGIEPSKNSPQLVQSFYKKLQNIIKEQK